MDALELDRIADETDETLTPIEELFEDAVELRPPGTLFMQATARSCRTVTGHYEELAVFCGETTRRAGESWCVACRARYLIPINRTAKAKKAA